MLFVFIDDRKMYIQVGYGLEGVLPDVTAFDITERHIKPRFRAGDYEGGLATGIDLMHEGDSRRIQRHGQDGRGIGSIGKRAASPALMFVIFIFILLMIARSSRNSRRRGWGYSGGGGPFIGGWGGGGGGWSGGSSSGGGFSGFSGGGGSSGGGGGGGSSW